MPDPAPERAASLLRQPSFTFYLLARVLGTLAVQMQSVAIGWQVYDLTGSLYDLGLIGLAQFAPFLLFILIAGHVADRYDRRIIILLCLSAQLLCGALLFALTFSGLHAVWPVFAVLALYGSARAFTLSGYFLSRYPITAAPAIKLPDLIFVPATAALKNILISAGDHRTFPMSAAAHKRRSIPGLLV